MFINSSLKYAPFLRVILCSMQSSNMTDRKMFLSLLVWWKHLGLMKTSNDLLELKVWNSIETCQERLDHILMGECKGSLKFPFRSFYHPPIVCVIYIIPSALLVCVHDDHWPHRPYERISHIFVICHNSSSRFIYFWGLNLHYLS